MSFKCVAMSASVDDQGQTLYDFEFGSHDGSSLMIANVVDNTYQLGSFYEITLAQCAAATTQETV